MSSKPRIAVIVGSTRPTRYADAPAQWILKQAQARGDLDVELVDLREYPLPYFDEIASNRWMPSRNPEAVRWQQTVGRFDGYIFVVAEYNHSITSVLKNALDLLEQLLSLLKQLFGPWRGLHSFRRPDEQVIAEDVAQAAESIAHRRLAKADAVRGAGHVALA